MTTTHTHGEKMKSAANSAVILSLMFTAVGCATVNKNELTADEALTLKGKSVVASKYNELPDFAAQTAANVQFGLLGLASAISSGNSMIKNNKIEDPAISISKKISDGLNVNQNMKVIQSGDFVSAKVTDDELIKTYGNSDYILDVKTTGWSSIYFPTDWDNYRVMYTAQARLIDVKSKQVVIEETCTHVPDYKDTNTAPNYISLENGSGLKESLSKSIDYCVNQIQSMAKLHTQNNTTAVTK
jgi:hypothetical protein